MATTERNRILAIESSCDETSLAVVDAFWELPGTLPLQSVQRPRLEVAKELIATQSTIHEAYGGVVPELAAREHLRNLPLLFAEIEAQISPSSIDAIAVTQGPGLKGCLLMGFHFAQGLARALNKPLLGINHIEGHILAPMLDEPDCTPPYIALVVSGGHTELLVVNEVGNYQVLARTSDDAAGEAFDKSAHLLGLEYPGGPRLARLADTYDGSEPLYPLPQVMVGNIGFSFSGLKTAIRLLVERLEHAGELNFPRIAASIQRAILDALLLKTKQALKESGLTRLVVTGGVAANGQLRKDIRGLPDITSFFPSQLHSMDNASMIAVPAAYRFRYGKQVVCHSDSVFSRWPVETLVPLL